MKSFKITYILSVLACLMIFSAFLGFHAQAEMVRSANTEVELVSQVKKAAPGDDFWVALRMKMDPHWHVYWRNPGDSGIPPAIQWDLPRGVEAGEIRWPYPRPIRIDPLVSYGYEREVWLLTKFSISPDAPSDQELTVKARVEWLACKIECVPGTADLRLQLPIAEGRSVTDETRAQHFAAYEAGLPRKNPYSGIRAGYDEDSILISGLPPEAGTGEEIFFYPYDDKLIDHAAEQRLEQENGKWSLKVSRSPLFIENKLDRLEGILVKPSGWKKTGSPSISLDLSLERLTETSPAKKTGAPIGLLTALLFAFLGGIILNLMPCVLPVLSIKILGLIEHAKESRTQIMKQGLLFALGILSAFWVLAGGLIALKALGNAVGWGFQFQSPAFLIAMSILFCLLAMSLFGVFEIGSSLTGAENVIKNPFLLRQPFVNGVLATIVATPCTAPFMGSAIGYALLKSPWTSLLIFTSLGLGMASPYLVVSAFPQCLKFLPKPGSWMLHLKQFFGFMFLATIVWLSWVLGVQRGIYAMGYLYSGLVLIALSVWIFGAWTGSGQSPWKKNAIRILAIALFVAGCFVSFRAKSETVPTGPQKAATTSSLDWQSYSESLISKLRKEGKPVFLDFTAEWCLTCKVNEKLVLENERVIRAFQDKGIVPVKADWTNYDEKITRALESFGKSSIPFYVYYPPGQGRPPVTLPELLTIQGLLNTIAAEGNE